MRLVWTQKKLEASGQTVLRKLLMLFQINNQLEPTIVIKGDNGQTCLGAALIGLEDDTLFPLSVFVEKLHGNTSYYDAKRGHTSNGLGVLKSCVHTELNNRCQASSDFAITYTKWRFTRNEPYSALNFLKREQYTPVLQSLFDWAAITSDQHVTTLCRHTNRTYMTEALTCSQLKQLGDIILTHRHNQNELNVDYYMEDIGKRLLDEKAPLPDEFFEYGLEQLDGEVTHTVQKYALKQLVRGYLQKGQLVK